MLGRANINRLKVGTRLSFLSLLIARMIPDLFDPAPVNENDADCTIGGSDAMRSINHRSVV